MTVSEKTDTSEGRIQNVLWFSSQTRRLFASYLGSSQKTFFEKGVMVVIGLLHSFHAYMMEQAGKIASEQDIKKSCKHMLSVESYIFVM